MKTAARKSGMESVFSVGVMMPLAALLSGCAGPLNTEENIGVRAGAWTPPTIGESAMQSPPVNAQPTIDQSLSPVYGANGEVPAQDGKRSVVGLDRSNWSDSVVAQPNDLSAHQPRFTDNVLFPEGTRRSEGKYPTAQSALDTATTHGNELQMKEALFAPFACAADVILFLPRLAFEARPDRPTRTGVTPYERTQTMRTLVPQPATPVEPKQVTMPAPAPAVHVAPPEAKTGDKP